MSPCGDKMGKHEVSLFNPGWPSCCGENRGIRTTHAGLLFLCAPTCSQQIADQKAKNIASTGPRHGGRGIPAAAQRVLISRQCVSRLPARAITLLANLGITSRAQTRAALDSGRLSWSERYGASICWDGEPLRLGGWRTWMVLHEWTGIVLPAHTDSRSA